MLCIDSSHSQGEVCTELAESLVKFHKALGDALRIEILRVLSRDSFAVLELCEILDLKQSALSHHLKVLAAAGLVSRRREGNTLFCRREYHAAGALQELKLQAFRAIDCLTADAIISERLTAIKQLRSLSSQQFFIEKASIFKEQQEQVAPYSVYGPVLAELLTKAQLGRDLAIELGPGEGVFLAELSQQFSQVIAVDVAEPMLAMSKAYCGSVKAENVRFILGDSQSSELQGLAPDCLVVNMVLHHVSSPANVIQDLADILPRGNKLYITELMAHDQDWVKNACGDIWLGFEPDDLHGWCASAGLQELSSVHLNQLNGFGVQIKEFIKQ